MKIMVMSDVESAFIWEHYKPGMFKDVDLILSAGDLNPHYLTFVETFANVPLLYVHGNHDEKYKYIPPEGCECIDDDIYVYNGIRILGLGGCMRYRRGAHQYTEREMMKRVRRLRWKLRWHKGFDILLTHAPIQDFHDMEDTCHRGFAAFRQLLEQYQPKYCIHGHIHMNYGKKTPRVSMLGDTLVVNAFRTYSFDYDDEALREEAARFE
ncbi:MAG: metallophosphoesterase family protein [Oscillospiraceae bacterium]|nr:metallophosphoesterase family protein [Oscillospiraceae bacterium]